MSEIRVRKATPRDVPTVVGIDRESGLTAWKADDFARFVRCSDSDLLVVCEGSDEPVGFVLTRRLGLEAELLKIAVGKGRQRSGLGQALLTGCLLAARTAGCSECFLEVRPSNATAIALYQKNGFTECGRRAGYYQDPPEAAIVMRKELGTFPPPDRLGVAW